MRLFFTHSITAFMAIYLYFMEGEPPVPFNALSTTILFVLLFILLWLSTALYNRTYFRKMPKAVNFLFYFLKELLVANLKIAIDILTPRYHMRPTVIALPLRARKNLEISLLANMINLTPGTLCLDVSKDRRTLYVHALYLKHNDIEQLKHHIKHGFERRILELTT
jgi:multicomponent Na+:H+ antiporter subunit E